MPTIDEIKEKSKKLFKLYPINKVTLFGSYAKGTQTLDSDIDFLIKDSNLSILATSNLKEQLTCEFNTKVDLISEGDLSDVFLFLIKDEEVVVYEK